MHIRGARAADVDAVTKLINTAFEVERFFKHGDRTTPDHVRRLLEAGTILLAETGLPAEAGVALAGSVYVEIRGDRAYIGMVSVEPSLQRGGIGLALMSAAEDYGRRRDCSAADVTVVNLRTELPPFYRKLGYVEAGTAPFEDLARAKQECHFIRMSKRL